MCSWKGCLYDLMKRLGFGVETLHEKKSSMLCYGSDSNAEIWYLCPYLSCVFIIRHVIESVTR